MVNKRISYGRQLIDNEDIQAVLQVLRSDFVTQGPRISEFESALAKYCGAKYAVAVSSGTAALHLACLVAGLNKGDEAITSPITFLATSNAVLYTGAKPVFADIDSATMNIDPHQIAKKLTKKTKALLPVHFAGLPCDMPRIAQLAKARGLVVIEDACHALGARYQIQGRRIRVGSCCHSDMSVFSFHAVKAITTGEGGAITTNNKKYYEQLKALRAHGAYKEKQIIRRDGPWAYEMRQLGFNYRITDIQCALGLSQLKKIDRFIKKRNEIARMYDKSFKDISGLTIQKKTAGCRHAYHLYIARIDYQKFSLTKKKFFTALEQEGILAQFHYIPIYRQPFYKENVCRCEEQFSEAERYYRQGVSLPIYPSMTRRDIERVIRVIKRLLT